jgi:hypothetical protein
MTSRVLALVLVIVGTACAKSRGTETGNPPVIAPRLITVEQVDEDHVRVSGAADAISPGGGEVSVTNTSRDGDPVVVDVAEDGSFSAELEGSPDDDYEVVAINEDGSSPPRVVSSGEPPPSGDWHTLHLCDPRDPVDNLIVTALSIEGDTLHVGVEHGGGCEEHSYGLCYGNAWAESHPIQVGLQVLHEDNGDGCQALLSEQLSFDLAPFKAAYAENYQTDIGAAYLDVASCMIEDGPADACRVLYEWGDPMSDCGPPIGPACPPFELPDPPASWVVHATECGFSFSGPDDLVDLNVQGVDSCVAEFENDACTFHVGSGAFSNGLTDFEGADEYEVGHAAIQGFDAKLVTAVLESGQRGPYAAGVHFPQPPFAGDSSFDVTADLLIFCARREQRDAMLSSLGTIQFD